MSKIDDRKPGRAVRDSSEGLIFSDKDYRLFFENASVGIFKTTLAGRALGCNEECARIMGFSSVSECLNSVSNVAYDLYAHAKDRERMLRQVREEGGVEGFEVLFKRKDGKKIWVSISLKTVPDTEAKGVLIGFVRDISSHMRAKRFATTVSRISNALNESRDLDELFREIHGVFFDKLGAKNFFIALIDQPNDRIVFPYFADEMDREITEIPNISDPANMTLTVEVVNTGKPLCIGKTARIERAARGHSKILGTVPEIWLGVPLMLKGRVIGAMAVQDYHDRNYFSEKDIELFSSVSEQVALAIERKQAADALRESENRYREIYENSVEGIYRTSYEGRFISVNPALAHILGYSSPEELMEADLDLATQFYAETGTRERLLDILDRDGRITDFMTSVRHRDGRIIWCVETSRCQKDESGRVLYFEGTLKDMTQQKLAQEQLLRAKEAAESANAAKTEFLANISHELRTPLNGVLGMLQLVQVTELNGEQREYIETALNSGRNLTYLINDLLSLSRIEAGAMEIKREKFKVAEVLDTAASMFKPQLAYKNLSIECEVDESVPEIVLGDEIRLRQILFNLVGNSLKFTDSGEVRIAVSRIKSYGQGKTVLLLFTVSDTGIGIQPEKTEQAFKTFAQLDGSYTRKYGGTGLGLGIVRRLVGLMGGSIAVESEEGEGTAIHFTIKVGMPECEPFAGSSPRDFSEIGPLRILLAEDDRVNRISATRMLEKHGHSVVGVENGFEVLEALSSGEFNVVLMDVQMPGMDGMEATRKIRGSSVLGKMSQIPIIALTAHAMEGDKDKFFRVGMTDYVAKPFDINNLLEAMGRILDRVD